MSQLEAEARLLPDVSLLEQVGNGGSGERQDPWSALQGHPRAEGDMLIQKSSPPHHRSSGSTNSPPPGVLQLEPASAPTGDPNSYIAQPGTAYTSAGHGHRWTPQLLRLAYWSLVNYYTPRRRAVPADNPPRRTIGVHLPTSTAARFANAPNLWTAPFPPYLPATLPYPRTRHATDAAAFDTRRTQRSFADRQYSHQRRPEVPGQRLPRLVISNPKQQHSTKRHLTP